MSDEFDDQFAAELIGAHVLVGLTRMDHGGNAVSQTQFHGKVTKADSKRGVTVVDAAGVEHMLPPYRAAYVVAEPGEYRLRSTGEIVVDPDYTCTWTVHPPGHH